MDKKKILFIHPDLKGGGAERVLVQLLNKLSKEEYEITLFTIFREGINGNFLSTDVKHIYLFKHVFRGYTLIQKIFPAKLISLLLPKGEFDIAIAFLEHVSTRLLYGYKTKRKIAWVHSTLTNSDLSKTFRNKNEMLLAYTSFDKIICVSEDSKRTFINQTGISEEKVSFIKNTLDLDFIDALTTDEHIYPHDFTIVSVGRLIEVKGYDRLLRIVNSIQNTERDFHLYILGDGHLKNDFQLFIKKNNLSNRVTLLGFQENPYRYIKNANLYVCSSYNEGYNTAVTEALYLKVPVITTDCPGMNHILNHGEFGVITENTEEDLKENILAILQSEELYNQLKEKAICKSKHVLANNTIEEVELLLQTV